MRLIDANKLRKDVLDLPNCYNGFSDAYDKALIIDLVDEQPTVDSNQYKSFEQYAKKRDFVEVVRCKDCQYASLTYDGECKYCQRWKEKYDGESVSLYLDGDFYCAFGERREDDCR